jgi:hypothetical protein
MSISLSTAPRLDWRLVGAPLLIALALFGAWVAVLAVPGAWLLPAFVIASTPRTAIGAASAVAAAIVLFFWRRHWVSGAMMLAGIILAVVASTVPMPAESLATRTAYLVYVVRYHDVIEDQLKDLRKRGISPAVAVVSIDGFGSMTNGIAYDPTGEILLPPAKRSRSWMATAGETELGVDGLEARRIVGNYYSWFHY